MARKRRSKEFKNNSRVINIEDARKKRLARRQAEREKEEEKLRYAASQNTRGKMAIRRSRRRRRILTVLFVVLIIAMIGFSVFNVISLKKEQHDVRQQREELNAEKKRLEKELEQVNDPENLEKQARNQLRLIKPGEYLYMFPDEIVNAGKAAEKNVVDEESGLGDEEEKD